MMRVSGAVFLSLVALLVSDVSGWAEPPQVVKIGVLSDMSGPFSDQVGAGSVAAANLAVEDFAKESRGLKVEIVSADHQNKPDVGVSIARRWVEEENVSAIVDLPNSGVALAVAGYLKGRHRAALASSSMTSDLTGSACSPVIVQWVSDTWTQGASMAHALTKKGLDTWYFLAVDYALGKALERDATAALQSSDGRVVGVYRHPLNSADFASPLLAAQSSGAKVLALANTGADMVTALKQAKEFGLTDKMQVAALFVQLSDVHSLGLPVAQGLQFTEAFYWDLNDRTRAWSKRFSERTSGHMPTEDHAGVYSTTLAYLRAVRDSGSIEGERVVSQMKSAPFEDELFGKVSIRADGRATHDMYLFQAKAPGESRSPYDLYQLVATIPAGSAFHPVGEGGCALK
jgi:branched-chain amino acid transport system substrate-binding protein